MSDLPKSFFVLAALMLIVIGVIFYSMSKQYLFRHLKRKGEDALRRRDYVTALRFLGRAEAFWGFNNAIRHSMWSHRNDLAVLDQLLNELDAAANVMGINLTILEYRKAVQVLQSEFEVVELGKQALSGKLYASAFMRFKNAQSILREELRASRNIKPGKPTGPHLNI